MNNNSTDMLREMFKMREEFMKSLNEAFPGTYEKIPLDLFQKKHQQICRDVALKGVEEMFEALQHLKNWKPHKKTEVKSFNKDEFLEEIVDAFNYFLTLIILTGFNENDLYESYVKKDQIIHERLKNEY